MYDIGCNHPGECSPEWSCCVCVCFFLTRMLLVVLSLACLEITLVVKGATFSFGIQNECYMS